MSAHRRGFTLVEMTVATVVVAVMSLGILNVVKSASSAMRTNAAGIDAYAKATRAFQKAERLLRGASVASLETLPEGFQTPQPVTPGVAVDNLYFRRMSTDPADPDALPSLGAPARLYLDGQNLLLERPSAPAELLATNVVTLSMALDGRRLSLLLGRNSIRPGGGTVTTVETRTVEIRND